MDRHNGKFTPENVDDQIDQLLQEYTTSGGQINDQKQTVSELHQMYSEDEQILQHVWKRISKQAEHVTTTPIYTQLPLPMADSADYRKLRVGTMSTHGQEVRTQHNNIKHNKHIQLAIAALILLVLASSTLAFFVMAQQTGKQTQKNVTTHQQSTPTVQPTQIVTPSGIYASNEEYVYRLDKQTREILWQEYFPDGDTKSGQSSTLLVENGIVYVNMGHLDRNVGNSETRRGLFALDAQTGKLRWELRNQNTFGMFFANEQTDVLYTYVGKDSTNAPILALNPITGKEQAHYSLPYGPVLDGILYHGKGNELFALKFPSGEQIWKVDSGEADLGLGARQVVDGTLYASATRMGTRERPRVEKDSYVYAFDVQTGQQLWRTAAMDDFAFRFTIVDGVLYCGSQDMHVYAYNTQTGERLWREYVGGSSPTHILAIDDMVYVNVGGSIDYGRRAGLAALDKTTGQSKWFKNDIAGNERAGLFFQDGVIYSGDSFGKTIFALNTNGEVLWEKVVASDFLPEDLYYTVVP